jgi:two-component system phosphate regulon sensor histidine kinase PhoR
MSTFEISPGASTVAPGDGKGNGGLGSAILLNNLRWFTNVRWIVVAVFVAIGLVGRLMPGMVQQLGVHPPVRWPWTMAIALAITNGFFCVIVRCVNERGPRHVVEANLWLQIVADLAAITLLVHIVGSTNTFVCFTYLFHIVIACIFFAPMRSLMVLVLAVVLYLGCVTAELSGLWPSKGILIVNPAGTVGQGGNMISGLAVSAVLIWSVVWYFVSSLSRSVRERDRKISEVNDQLLFAQEEKNREVLRTTHDLKAPFSGIESNIQVLKLQHWDGMSEGARELIERIQVRSHTLSERIRDILVLGKLRTQAAREDGPVIVDLKAVLEAVAAELADKAAERDITVSVSVQAAQVRSAPKQLAILFSNLLANAISYSRDGEGVEVVSRKDDDAAVVSIIDHGIGIADDALPHVFEEYFRSAEASKFNRASTGLGLAIVRRIALNLGLGIKVSSEQGKGTSFEVTIPTCEANPNEGESSG